MASSRATSSGVYLQIGLAGGRQRAALEAELRDAVREGRLKSGTRLPSSRSFAQEIGIARNTVAEAYSQLIAEGWLVARHGAGTWVAERPDARPDAPTHAAAEPLRPRFDLRPGLPDLGGFPRSAWLSAARRALAVASDESLGYGDPRGLTVLREALAGYLLRARRVATGPEQIVVCAGFAEALRLLCAVLRRRGASTVAVEGFGQRLYWDLIEAGGLTARFIGVDERGAVTDELGTDAAAALLTPAHQFPLGVALDPARRRQAIAWAADTGSIVIEDDYDGEFRYDRQAIGAMQSLAADHVVYAGTAAKSLAPGLRLGWLVLPASLIEEVVEAKRSMGAFPATVDQLIFAEFLACGGFDRHVRRVRMAYRRRREGLLAYLSRSPQRIEVSGIAAGLHALIHLGGRSEREVIERAAERGLALEGLGDYAAPGHARPAALVIGYATPPAHAYSAALARLVAVFSE
jgi:GntR family transcriptional regulator / MocR family aminotransferase